MDTEIRYELSRPQATPKEVELDSITQLNRSGRRWWSSQRRELWKDDGANFFLGQERMSQSTTNSAFSAYQFSDPEICTKPSYYTYNCTKKQNMLYLVVISTSRFWLQAYNYIGFFLKKNAKLDFASISFFS